MKTNKCCEKLIKEILEELDNVEYWKDKEVNAFVCYKDEVERMIKKKLETIAQAAEMKKEFSAWENASISNLEKISKDEMK